VSIRPRAEELLRRLTADSDTTFREDQHEAIEQLVVDRSRVLVVQRTGWGKSAVYFIATRLLRDEGAGATVLISPLLALMRNQIEMARRVGVRAATINSSNRDDWTDIEEEVRTGAVDLLLISPERLNNARFRSQMSSRRRGCSLSMKRTASATGGTTSAPTTGASAESLAAYRAACRCCAPRPPPTTA
jgi:ATP-dependent DNA helicase RecQ